MQSRRLLRLLAALFALTLVAAACSDDGDDGDDESNDDTTEGDTAASTTSAAPSTTATIPEGGEEISGLAVTEVVFGDDGHVTLRNVGTEEVSLDGAALCNRPAYIDLSGSLAPGATLEVPASDLGGLPEAGGEAGLYSAGRSSFDDSGAMLDYVQWGAGGGRESVAVAAGLWEAGFSVEPLPGAGFIEQTEVGGGPQTWE